MFIAIRQFKNKPQPVSSGGAKVNPEIKLDAAAASKKENSTIDKKAGCC